MVEGIQQERSTFLEPVVLAIDVGTSRIKGSLVDARGNVIGRSVVRGTSLEAQVLLDTVASVIDEVIEQPISPISAVSLSTFWHGLLLVGRDGTPVGPISTWQDTGSVESAKELRNAIDPLAYHKRTGCFLHPSYPMVRIHARNRRGDGDPEPILGPGEWLTSAWFGEPLTSPSMASGTGLTKLGGTIYDEELLDLIEVDEKLLPVIRSSAVDSLLPEWSARWPALASALWFLPIGDGAAETLGSDCRGLDRAALKLGTSGAVRLVLEHLPEPPDSMYTYAVAAGTALVGGATSNAANVIDWARKVFHFEGDVVAEALSRPHGSHDLVVQPHLAGERAPRWPLESHGSIEGIRLTTTALDIVQALIESLTDNLIVLVQEIEAWHGRPVELVASGGLVEKYPSWTRLLYDRLGRPIYAAPSPHAGVRGAALVALDELGVEVAASPLEELPH